MKRILILALMLAAATSAFAIKITYGPYIQNVTENSFTVVWTTDKNALSWVEIAPDDNTHFYAFERPKYFQTTLGRKNVGKLHCVTIPKLEKNTLYRYRCYSQEVTSNKGGKTLYGLIASTRIFGYRPLEVRTLNYNKADVRCLILNDIHGNETLNSILEERFGLYQKRTTLKPAERKKDAAARKAKGELDMIIYNGDMASSDDDKAGRIFRNFLGISSQTFADELPLVMVRGVNESGGKLGEHYMDYFPSNTGKPYFTLRQGSVCFIVLDSGNDQKDKSTGYDYESYRAEQALWLKEALQSKEVKEAKYKVALMHIPPVAGVSPVSKDLHSLFVPLLEEAGINLMICGYTHGNMLHKANKKCKFPILVNGSGSMLDFNASAAGIEIIVEDFFGKQLQSYTF